MSKKNIISMMKRSTKAIFTEIKKYLREPYGTKKLFKYFTGYNDNDDIRPLCIRLPQMTGYVKCFDSNKTISFKVIDKKLLKKYTKI